MTARAVPADPAFALDRIAELEAENAARKARLGESEPEARRKPPIDPPGM